jgi:hypothetical protein
MKMTQITIDSGDILKALAIIMVVVAICAGSFYAGTVMYNRASTNESAAPVYVTPNQPAVIYVQPHPTLIYVTPTPKTDYISDVQSTGTEYGYVCLVDRYGKEYLINYFDRNTVERLGASYSGTESGTYNGIPILDDVVMTANPQYYYNGWSENNHRYYNDEHQHRGKEYNK